MSHHQGQLGVKEEPQITTIGAKRKTISSSTLSAQQVPALLSKLDALLPYSIPLLRRIQFHLHQPVSETARIFVAVASDAAERQGEGSGDGDREMDIGGWSEAGNDPRVVDRWLCDGYHSADGRGPDQTTSMTAEAAAAAAAADPQPWIAAHIDLVHAGQTQVWVFASWEADGRYPFPSSASTSASTSTPESQSRSQSQSSSPASCSISFSPSSDSPSLSPAPAIHNALMHSLFHYIRTDLVPRLPTSPPAEWLELQRTGKYLSTPYSRNKVLFGTVSEKLWGHFPLQARTRTDAGYWKYLFQVVEDEPSSPLSVAPNSSTTPPLLPPGYEFGPMRPSDLQTVLDRTPIPRTLATLRQFISLGLFHRDGPGPDPVGWGFLGKDASLSSLHTEPEHRGKGLAVALGRELLRRQHIVSPSAAAEAEKRKEKEKETGGHVRGGTNDEHGVRSRETTTGYPSTDTDTDTNTDTSIKTSDIWAHADVSQSNTASRRVMEKLGGVPLWMVMWTEVDMEKMSP